MPIKSQERVIVSGRKRQEYPLEETHGRLSSSPKKTIAKTALRDS